MCGITGYIGKRDATPILIEGLKKLEYRGYDSAGIALLDNGKMNVCKKKGRVDVLAEEISKKPFNFLKRAVSPCEITEGYPHLIIFSARASALVGTYSFATTNDP